MGMVPPGEWRQRALSSRVSSMPVVPSKGSRFRNHAGFRTSYGDEVAFRLLGTGRRAAARQAAALFLLAGALALVGIPGRLGSDVALLAVAAGDFLAALVALLMPWERLRPAAPAALGLPGFAVLGLATWSFGGVVTGTGPFLVLLYAWAALHFPRWILLAYLVPATLAYDVPLILTGQPPIVLGSAVVVLPVALTVA